jgi:hypothetical protein
MGRYTYRFNPRTLIFGRYAYSSLNYDSPAIDYDIHRPSLGISHSFSSTLRGSAQAGYYWQNPERGTSAHGPYFDISLLQRADKTTYTISFQGGYAEDYFTAENLGFTKYYRGIGRIGHQRLAEMQPTSFFDGWRYP